MFLLLKDLDLDRLVQKDFYEQLAIIDWPSKESESINLCKQLLLVVTHPLQDVLMVDKLGTVQETMTLVSFVYR